MSTHKLRFWLGLALLGALMTGPFILTALLFWFDLDASDQALAVKLLQPRLPLGTMLTLFGFVAGAMLLAKLYRQYVDGLSAMSEQLRLMHGANRDFRLPLSGPREVQAVAGAANALADQRNALLNDVETQIAEAKASIEEERNRLAALMSELAMGVVVCNRDGRILLYNQRARQHFTLLEGHDAKAGAIGQGAYIGLGRSIYAVLDKQQIAHAEATIRQRCQKGESEVSAHIITSAAGGRLLRLQMAPVRSSQGVAADNEFAMSGYVLTIDDITRHFEREHERDTMITLLSDGSRAGLAAIRAATENLLDDPAMPETMRERFLTVIRDEAESMGRRVNETTHRFADSLKTRWPLEELLGVDLVRAAADRIDQQLQLLTKIEDIDDRVWIRADSLALMQAMVFLASRLVDHYDIRELRFRLKSEGQMAFVDLIWSGQPVSSETLYTWELEPMTVGNEVSPLTLRDVIDRHSGEIWFQREKTAHRVFIRLVLPLAKPPERATVAAPAAVIGERPEFYDFHLFDLSVSGIDLDQRLDALAYTIFDTETTGLEPSAGDEIIQIGAVRLVNGRLLRHETFEQLVNPQIPLKPEGIPIHGITEAMLVDQPTLAKVLPAFHGFCSETVLVAHNAAFDMRFLQLKEASLGIVFQQPVLDTLLLSAVIHPNQSSHKLDDIAARLGVTVAGRHTALGDALTTAEVFLRMIGLLADLNIVRLREAIEASKQTYFARVSY